MVGVLNDAIGGACGDAFKRVGVSRKRRIRWWNSEVTRMRKTCRKKRKLYQRMRGEKF